MSESNNNDFWQCKCCNHKVDENSVRKVLPISLGGDEATPEKNLTFFVCPNCLTLQLPEAIFEAYMERLNSNLIY